MKKGTALIAMLLAAALMLSGCNLIGYDSELDGAQVVARVNDTELTKAEWQAYRDYLVSYMQDYYLQYFGISIPMTEEDVAAYGETALEQMIETVVIEEKLAELGFDPLGEEDAAEVESYADDMIEFYKLMVRYQNYPDLETVEEEAERLAAEAEATPAEATPDEAADVPADETEADAAADEQAAEGEEAAAEDDEPKATITNAQLDEMLTNDLNAMGMTREYFVQNQTATVQNQLLYDYVTADVTVSDDEVKAEFDSRVASQQQTYDETPTVYASAESNGTTLYYTPAGYRGVKNLLIGISEEKQAEIDELNGTITTAQTALDDAQTQLDELSAEDTSAYDEEAKAAYDEQVAALNETIAQSQTTVDETQSQLDAVMEEAFAEILPTAEEVLSKAQAGETFDDLIATYGTDTGMTTEPNKSRGYLVCEGLTIYEQSFQDAAMALTQVGEISGLVKTSYGYHILQYATDVPSGPVEYTEEIQESIRTDLLTTAKDAAYDAAITQWVSEADVETFPKVME